ncbi:MAG: complex I NDUFA9 subunit family protein [Alphaproteobacteria bacterium]
MQNEVITIFGGTGFVGRHIIKHLVKNNYQIQIICRDPEAGNYLKTFGDTGQIVLTKYDITKEDELEKLLTNTTIVINLVGILFEKGKYNFKNIHVKAPSNLAKICAKLKIKQFIHFSALGVEENQSNYAKSKFEGEKLILESFPNAVIIRPSIIFGAEDNFINKFIRMAKISPFLPLIGNGKTKFQPVFVDDISKIIEIIIKNNITKRIIELAGPKIYSFKEILNLIKKTMSKKRHLINIPFEIASLIGSICNLLPNPILTNDQVRSLRYDNIIKNDNNTKFSDFNIVPKSLEDEIVKYFIK